MPRQKEGRKFTGLNIGVGTFGFRGLGVWGFLGLGGLGFRGLGFGV